MGGCVLISWESQKLPITRFFAAVQHCQQPIWSKQQHAWSILLRHPVGAQEIETSGVPGVEESGFSHAADPVVVHHHVVVGPGVRSTSSSPCSALRDARIGYN
jgi:hypothetical protein